MSAQSIVSLEIDGAEVDLSVPAPEPWSGTGEEWVKEVARVSADLNKLQFYFGDLLNQGIAAFGEVAAYMRATAVSGRDRETLRFYAWVAKKVPRSRRVKELSFNHHRAVAALHPAIQATMLARAAEEDLTVRDMQAIASCNTAPLTPAAVTATKGVHCLVPLKIYRELEQIAKWWDEAAKLNDRAYGNKGHHTITVQDVVLSAITKCVLDAGERARQEEKANASFWYQQPAGSEPA